MKRQITFLSFLLIFIASCSFYNINSEEVGTNFYPSKSSANDVEYIENVSQAHEIIGFITVNTERNKRMKDVIAQMRKEAALMGADAITNITTDASGTWKKLPPQKLLGNAYVRANFTGTAIRLTNTTSNTTTK